MAPSSPSSGLGAFLDSGEIITFVVRDLDAARRFYVDQLRLPIEEEIAGCYVMVRAGSTRLCIDLADSEQSALGGGAVAILFSSNLSKAEQFLRDAGVPFTRGQDPEHGAFLLLRDPEGYLLSVSEAH
jgi:catechol 2,3-dioxygenase-like lactoylglutathione lyase family enzyme